MKTTIFVVMVQRESNSNCERGIRIGEGGPIFSLQGEEIKKIYDCHPAFDEGCFTVCVCDK
jgi:hypothetical protein